MYVRLCVSSVEAPCWNKYNEVCVRNEQLDIKGEWSLGDVVFSALMCELNLDGSVVCFGFVTF